MSRTPPNLVYLAIYNPTLCSTNPRDEDEDAEEQAHILLYTSREKAVSRDRMLRQIGLAKALVSFAGMFDSQRLLDTVHSQTRRMIMVSPEPDFWIHACIELAKSPRIVQDKGKSKSKDRAKAKGKEKGRDKGKDVGEGPVYDYEDGSVHDNALKQDIMRGYERFKLTHGSFTAILDALGQEALGLQLERFWTPWAWSWSLEDGQDFGQHLGIALHSCFKALLPTLDELQDDLPQDSLVPLLLRPTSVIPSTIYLQHDYPISLPLYLSSLIPPLRDPSIHSQDELLASSQATIKGPDKAKDQDASESQNTSTFLNMQAMDVRKWNWGGVLTFGRNSGKTSPQGTSAMNSAAGTAPTNTAASSRRGSVDQPASPHVSSSCDDEHVGDKGKIESVEEGRKSVGTADTADRGSTIESTVDLSALNDAISSKVSPAPSMKDANSSMTPEISPSGTSTEMSEERASTGIFSTRVQNVDGDGNTAEDEKGEEEEKKTIREPENTTPRPLPAFLRRTVHLQEGDDPRVTCQRKVYFLLKGQWMLALIGAQSEGDGVDIQQYLDGISGKSEKFFETVEEIVQDESIKTMTDSLPSASKILQPLDTHIGTTGKYTFSSNHFRSKSGILHEARALQDRDPEILEVFSRGQSPQYWHMARRMRTSLDGQHTNHVGGLGEPTEMYMEVFRKEASLADVDNVMTSVVKNCQWKGVVEDVDGS